MNNYVQYYGKRANRGLRPNTLYKVIALEGVGWSNEQFVLFEDSKGELRWRAIGPYIRFVPDPVEKSGFARWLTKHDV